ncbi:glycosyltransferase family 61 protein [Hymenobacter sp. UYP22]|uniref:glycosyltransferase family 61 protein n=1 Tax=Hymenobacter sp. UYP22 TaxID=3156348 RepID=UPI003392D8B9
MTLKRIASDTKVLLKNAALTVSKQIWRAPLSQSASFALLQGQALYEEQHPSVQLSGIRAANGGSAQHTPEVRSFAPDYVWQVCTGQHDIRSLVVCRTGGLLINGRTLLDLDFTATAGLLDSPFKRRHVHYPLVVAPWPHLWGGFYDYTTFVVAKLCRIERALGPGIWQQAKVCYPLLHTQFEKDFLALLGIPAANIIDTAALWGTELRTDCALVANSQPSWSSSLGDLALLRARFRRPKTAGPPWRRLYISRGGRRRVLNEEPVRALLQAHGFEIIEDEPRSVSAQIELFQEAAVIVTPHGAGLTNLLWCEPGTKVLEFCYDGYRPNYFYYLCTALHLHYQFLVDYRVGPTNNHWTNVSHDIMVPLADLEHQLNLLLS